MRYYAAKAVGILKKLPIQDSKLACKQLQEEREKTHLISHRFWLASS